MVSRHSLRAGTSGSYNMNSAARKGRHPSNTQGQWSEFEAMVTELELLQREIREYADALLRIAGANDGREAGQQGAAPDGRGPGRDRGGAARR